VWTVTYCGQVDTAPAGACVRWAAIDYTVVLLARTLEQGPGQ